MCSITMLIYMATELEEKRKHKFLTTANKDKEEEIIRAKLFHFLRNWCISKIILRHLSLCKLSISSTMLLLPGLVWANLKKKYNWETSLAYFMGLIQLDMLLYGADPAWYVTLWVWSSLICYLMGWSSMICYLMVWSSLMCYLNGDWSSLICYLMGLIQLDVLLKWG